MLLPGTVYRYDVNTDSLTVFEETEVPGYDPNEFSVRCDPTAAHVPRAPSPPLTYRVDSFPPRFAARSLWTARTARASPSPSSRGRITRWTLVASRSAPPPV